MRFESNKRGIPPAPPYCTQLREVRELAGLTQSQAAEMLYVTLRTYSRWESQDSGTICPASAWELFLLKLSFAGVVLPARYRQVLLSTLNLQFQPDEPEQPDKTINI